MKILDYEKNREIREWIKQLVPNTTYQLTLKAWDEWNALRGGAGYGDLIVSRSLFIIKYSNPIIEIYDNSYHILDDVYDENYELFFDWYGLKPFLLDINNLEVIS